jgi:hypothetical protein
MQLSHERREEEVSSLERKLLMEKNQLYKDMDRVREQIALDAKREAENGLHAKTRAIWADNKRCEKGDTSLDCCTSDCVRDPE